MRVSEFSIFIHFSVTISSFPKQYKRDSRGLPRSPSSWNLEETHWWPMAKKRLPVSSSASSLLSVLPSSSLRSRFWFGMKLVSLASAFLCLIAFVGIRSPFRGSSFYIEKARSSAAEAQRTSYAMPPFEGFPRVAFLFLARSGLPLDFLWHVFFQHGDAEKFSIYVHSKPGFMFDASTTKSPYFYGRQLKKSIRIVWGGSSMIEGERLLFKAALKDPANQRFVLLSESCIPLHDFNYTYNYLMFSPSSFIDSFVISENSRYNPNMHPRIPRDRWRKGSQWATLIRRHAVVVASDNLVFPVFKKHCKMHLDDDGDGLKKREASKKELDCVPDEHYIQTLFSMSGLAYETERRSLTYTFWNHSTSGTDKQDWHPVTFDYAEADSLLINKIRGINRLYVETEYRTEECLCHGEHVACYLFARKFTQAAAMRLLSQGVVGPFDPNSLQMLEW